MYVCKLLVSYINSLELLAGIIIQILVSVKAAISFEVLYVILLIHITDLDQPALNW